MADSSDCGYRPIDVRISAYLKASPSTRPGPDVQGVFYSILLHFPIMKRRCPNVGNIR
ncbi:hypothetical protein CBFG_01359 [Clostridiales bacterium 1_7_47FAA]|nr:hypothetical protein CBFG_01359 [Clostridiales bacterium 1_7_47FAA]